jgi:hypothetical protein
VIQFFHVSKLYPGGQAVAIPPQFKVVEELRVHPVD